MEALVSGTRGAAFWRDKRVLLTGHTGFKGAWLALWLRQLGADVTGLALEASSESLYRRAGLDDMVASRLVDLRDAAATAATVREARPQIVFHLAAQALVRASYREPIATFATNTMGTAHLLDALRDLDDVCVAVIVTTDKVYRNNEWPYPYREEDALGGHDPYSASKAAAELVAASYRSAFLEAQQTAVATARAGNVIGGGDWSEDRLIPDLVRAATRGTSTPIRYPQATRPWQHVLEPLAGYLLLGQRLLGDPHTPAEAWNFGPDAAGHLSVGDVVGGFARHWPAVRWSTDMTTPWHEAAVLQLDCRKAHCRLGWRPVWNTDITLERTARWYRRQHEVGEIESRADIDRYVADAHAAGLVWAVATRGVQAA